MSLLAPADTTGYRFGLRTLVRPCWPPEQGDDAGPSRSAQLAQAAEPWRQQAACWQRVLDADRPDREARIAAALREPPTGPTPPEQEAAASR